MGATSSPLRFSLALEVRGEKEKAFPASPPKPGKSALGTRLFWGVTFGPGIFVGVFEALVFFFLGGGREFLLLFDHPRHLKYGLPLWDLSALGGVAAVYGSPGNRLNANMLQILAA